MKTEWILYLLPWLLLLACPLGMWWMMRGMHGGGGRDAAARPDSTDEITELRARLARLEEAREERS